MIPATCLLLSIVGLGLALFTLKVYGVILSFRYKWYIGVIALLVPGLAEITAIVKVFLKKDLFKINQ